MKKLLFFLLFIINMGAFANESLSEDSIKGNFVHKYPEVLIAQKLPLTFFQSFKAKLKRTCDFTQNNKLIAGSIITTIGMMLFLGKKYFQNKKILENRKFNKENSFLLKLPNDMLQKVMCDFSFKEILSIKQRCGQLSTVIENHPTYKAALHLGGKNPRGFKQFADDERYLFHDLETPKNIVKFISENVYNDNFFKIKAEMQESFSSQISKSCKDIYLSFSNRGLKILPLKMLIGFRKDKRIEDIYFNFSNNPISVFFSLDVPFEDLNSTSKLRNRFTYVSMRQNKDLLFFPLNLNKSYRITRSWDSTIPNQIFAHLNKYEAYKNGKTKAYLTRQGDISLIVL